jgi:uncharacterized BrkB/YihY/UPF0761 family membrane protein
MSSQIERILLSAALGVLMVILFWLVFFVSLPVLSFFIGDASEIDLEKAAIVRTTIYITLLILSAQVWFFSTLYFFDRKRK